MDSLNVLLQPMPPGEIFSTVFTLVRSEILMDGAYVHLEMTLLVVGSATDIADIVSCER